MRQTRSRLSALAVTTLLAVGALLAGPASGVAAAGGPSTDKHNVPLAQGTSAQSLFAAPGEHQVASTTSVKPCEWPLGQDPADYVDLVGTVIDAQRSGTFPYGTRSPVGVNLYYPEGAAAGEQFPALVWSPGTITDPGMYDASAWLLASDPDFTGAEHNSQAAALN